MVLYKNQTLNFSFLICFPIAPLLIVYSITYFFTIGKNYSQTFKGAQAWDIRRRVFTQYKPVWVDDLGTRKYI